ncbi:hypothetical protein WJX75_009225 [Coccomyxa subellipsoidea]|uniref:Uncharacterized protein n=1 Tax=Coccomyxa subellipsoidea TaxID=248742 RepID=A0ABR2Z548_9CHLO
MRTSVCCIKLI